MNKITKTQISKNIFRFQENSNTGSVDAYLVCGSKSAIVIDGLEGARGLLKMVKEVTELPLSMIATHGHPDHIGRGLYEFMREGYDIYISPKDLPMLEAMYGKKIKKEQIKNLEGGMIFDLGGIQLEAMEMPGHTQGSILLYMEKENILFTSDAVGAGVLWMQLKECSPLNVYQGQLEKFLKFLENHEGIRIYPGHAKQIVPNLHEGQDYIDIEYVREVLELTKCVIAGTMVGEPREIPFPGLEGVKIRAVGGKYIYEYCYDEDKITK